MQDITEGTAAGSPVPAAGVNPAGAVPELNLRARVNTQTENQNENQSANDADEDARPHGTAQALDQPPLREGATPRDWAHYYVGACGFTLTLPFDYGTKEITRPGWTQVENSIRTPEDVDRLIPESHANIGLHLGLSGLCSLDIDHYESVALILSTIGIDIDRLVTEYPTLSGNPERRRVLFRVQPGVELKYHNTVWPERGGTVMELRAGLRMDVLPPSRHPDGFDYRWHNGPWEFDSIPYVPEELLALWLRPDAGEYTKSLNPWAKGAPKVVRQSSGDEAVDSEASELFDVFADKVSIASILDQHADKYTRKGERWLPKTSTSGAAGIVILRGGGDGRERLFCHNASDPLYTAPGTARDAFDVFTTLEHGGDVKAAFRAATELLGFKSGVRPEYVSEDGGLWRWKRAKQDGGDTKKPVFVWVRERLSNFEARIVAEQRLDDGVNRTSRIRIATVHNGLSRSFWIPTEHLVDVQAWALREGGATYSVDPRVYSSQSYARAAIQSVSEGQYGSEDVFTHTGWRKIGDEWAYLTEGGAVGSGHEVNVEMEGALAGLYSIPREPHDVVEAVRASLELPYLGADGGQLVPAVAVLLAAAYRAPLCEVRPANLAVWVEGETGTLKTTTAKLVMGHYGPAWKQAKLGWQSTRNAMEKLLSCAKDAPLLLDDWLPANDQHGRTVEGVLRAQGNKQARSRMSATRSLENPYTPRGILIATAEDRSTRRSANARSINVLLKRGDIDLDRLDRAEAARPLLPHAMSAYLVWLAPQIEELRTSFEASVFQHRKALGQGDHARHAENLAELLAAYELFLDFAQSIGAVSDAGRERLSGDFRGALEAVGARQSDVSFGDRPAVTFLRQLDSLVASGQVRLEEPTFALDDPRPLVGYQTDDEWWLIWETAWREVQKQLGPDRIASSDKAVCAELVGLGVLKPGGEGKFTLKRAVRGARLRFSVLDRWAAQKHLGMDQEDAA